VKWPRKLPTGPANGRASRAPTRCGPSSNFRAISHIDTVSDGITPHARQFGKRCRRRYRRWACPLRTALAQLFVISVPEAGLLPIVFAPLERSNSAIKSGGSVLIHGERLVQPHPGHFPMAGGRIFSWRERRAFAVSTERAAAGCKCFSGAMFAKPNRTKFGTFSGRDSATCPSVLRPTSPYPRRPQFAEAPRVQHHPDDSFHAPSPHSCFRALPRTLAQPRESVALRLRRFRRYALFTIPRHAGVNFLLGGCVVRNGAVCSMANGQSPRRTRLVLPICAGSTIGAMFLYANWRPAFDPWPTLRTYCPLILVFVRSRENVGCHARAAVNPGGTARSGFSRKRLSAF